MNLRFSWKHRSDGGAPQVIMTDGEGGPDTCVLCGHLPLAEVLTAPHPSSEESTQRSLPVAEVTDLMSINCVIFLAKMCV